MASLRRLFARRPRPRLDEDAAPVVVTVPPQAEPVAPPVPAAPEALPPTPETPPVARTRHGSQSRQRTKAITVPCTPEEYAALTGKATEAGLSAGGFLRACGFGAPTPSTQRRTPVDRALMAEAIGALNRTGNNLNQIAKALNSGEGISSDAIKAMQHGYADALNRLMHAAASAPQQGGAANDR